MSPSKSLPVILDGRGILPFDGKTITFVKYSEKKSFLTPFTFCKSYIDKHGFLVTIYLQ